MAKNEISFDDNLNYLAQSLYDINCVHDDYSQALEAVANSSTIIGINKILAEYNVVSTSKIIEILEFVIGDRIEEISAEDVENSISQLKKQMKFNFQNDRLKLPNDTCCLRSLETIKEDFSSAYSGSVALRTNTYGLMICNIDLDDTKNKVCYSPRYSQTVIIK